MKPQTLITIFGTLLGASAIPLSSESEGARTVKITANAGTIVGSLVDGVEYYRGVPYALPPVGSLRLRPPKRLEHFGTIDATGLGPSCPQFTAADGTELFNKALGVPGVMETLFYGSALGDETEDCLTISVMRPQNTRPTAKLPVLFWMHGGGFQLGSAQPYNASVLIPRAVSQDKPFILVSVNYRLGAFGFLGGKEILADGAANLGLLDQRMALEWVADNIAAFGGDPDAVTISGESAGAISTFSQMALFDGNNTYNGKPLFRAAIMNSGSLTPAEPIDGVRAQEIFDTVANEAGCGSAKESKKVECLRQSNYDTLKNAAAKVPSFLGYHNMALSYAPRPDGRIITDSTDILARTGKFAAVPIIIGNQENEGTVFASFTSNITTRAEVISYFKDNFFRRATRKEVAGLVDTYARNLCGPSGSGSNETYPEFRRMAGILGDFGFTLMSRILLDVLPDSVPAWSYLSTYERDTPILGTYHTSDLPRLFYRTDAASRSVQDRHIAFISSLDPNEGVFGQGYSTYWPTWREERQLLAFGSKSTSVVDGSFRNRSFEYIHSHLDILRL